MGEAVAVRPTNSEPYAPAEVELALRLLAINGGNCEATSRALVERGLAPVASRTLLTWRTDSHRERYLEIAAQLQPEIEKALVASTLDYLQEAERLKGDLLGELAKQVKAGEVKDPAKSLQNLSVSQGIGIDTVLKVQGRPTQLIQHSTVDESLATLQRLGIVVDGSAEEISDAEVVEQESGVSPEGAAAPRETADETPAHAPS